ncbi:pleckstrin homology-like domain family A member 2 [Lissotriton helveticus]
MSPQFGSPTPATLASRTPMGSEPAQPSDTPRSRAHSRSGRARMPADGAQVIMEGELEKRSDNLLQLWKRKVCVLTKDSLAIYADGPRRARCKELPFHSIKKLDCVERTGKYIYFTIVTTENKEIDFRCSEQSCWNAAITMALIDFQNKKAIQHFRARQGSHVRRPSSAERPTARCV